MGEFSWTGSEVVFPSMYGIAVYKDVDGLVVIRQQDPMGGGDSVIVIPRMMVNAVAAALRKQDDPSA